MVFKVMTDLTTQLATPEDIFEAVSWALSRKQAERNSDRRISERTIVHLPIVVQQIDEHGEPHGHRFTAITKDVSVGGIGIMSQQAIDSPQILVQFESPEAIKTSLLLNLHYSYQVGPFFFAGASFCADWTTDIE